MYLTGLTCHDLCGCHPKTARTLWA